jgi:hypothetical protein
MSLNDLTSRWTAFDILRSRQGGANQIHWTECWRAVRNDHRGTGNFQFSDFPYRLRPLQSINTWGFLILHFPSSNPVPPPPLTSFITEEMAEKVRLFKVILRPSRKANDHPSVLRFVVMVMTAPNPICAGCLRSTAPRHSRNDGRWRRHGWEP